MSINLNWGRWFSIVHRVDHLHFFDPWRCLRKRTVTSTHLGLESYLPTWKRWKCGEFFKMKLRDLKLCGYAPSAGKNSWLMVSLQISALDRLSISFFTSSDRFPCTISHWVSACSPLIPGVKHSLIRCRCRIGYGTWTFLMYRANKFHFSSRRLWSRLSIQQRLGTIAGWMGTWDKFSTANRLYILKLSRIIGLFLSFPQFLYLWSKLLKSNVTFSQFMPGEFVNSHFLSSLQFFHLMDISDASISKVLFLVEPILREVGPALIEIFFCPIIYAVQFQTIRNELVFEIHECKCWEYHLYILASRFRILLLRVDDLFVLQELFSQLLEDQGTWRKFHLFLGLIDVLRTCLLCRKMFLTRLSFVWEHCGKSPCTFSEVIWTGLWDFSERVINSWSVCTCFSLLQVQRWSQHIPYLIIVQIRFRRESRNALSWTQLDVMLNISAQWKKWMLGYVAGATDRVSDFISQAANLNM